MTAVLLFLLGVFVGCVGQAVWSFALELFDIYREEREER